MAKQNGIPMQVAKRYYRSLRPLIKKMVTTTTRVYNTEMAAKIQEFQAKSQAIRVNASAYQDFLSQIGAELDALLIKTKRNIENTVFSQAKVEKLAKTFVQDISRTQLRDMTQRVAGTTGKPLEKLIAVNPLQGNAKLNAIANRAIKDNVNLIKTIPNTHFTEVRKLVKDGLEKGRSTRDIGKDISTAGGVSDRRGAFIARDQLGKIHGDIQKERAKSAGLSKFIWRTCQDERVRDTHADLEGMVFDWDTGATGPGVDPSMEGLLPGEDYNCRCTSEEVDDELEEKAAEVPDDEEAAADDNIELADEPDNDSGYDSGDGSGAPSLLQRDTETSSDGLSLSSVAQEMQTIEEVGYAAEQAMLATPVDIPDDISKVAESVFTEDEFNAVKEYTSGSYNGINGYLRSGRAINTTVAKDMVDKIDSFIDKASNISEATQLYRGTDLGSILSSTGTDFVSPTLKLSDENLAVLNRKLVGKIYSDKAFTSTSKAGFLEAYNHGVEMRIEAAVGSKGVDISKVSQVEGESEVLLPRNANMTVTGVKKEKGKWVVFLKYS